MQRRAARIGTGMAAAVVVAVTVGPAATQEVTLTVPGGSEALRDGLRSASVVLSTLAEGPVPPSDVIAAARAEYGRLVGALYARGHYSGVVSVRIDGREVAEIPVLEEPARIGQVDIRVAPGPPFRFSRAEIAPLAPRSELPPEFAAGQPAPSGVISDAVEAAVDDWRGIGHAKAEPAGQNIVADHARATLDARLGIAPGPRLRFGPLRVSGNEQVRTERILEIAGLPEREVFSPEDLRRSADRLLRTGAFSSVTLREAETPGPGDLLPIDATVVEERPRRIGFGAEISSAEGLALSSYWLHRNLLGGAERLRLDGSISGIGGQTGGEDYLIGASYARPGTFQPDTTFTLEAKAERRFEPDYDLTSFELGTGLSRIFTDELTASIGLSYRQSRVEDDLGTTDYRTLSIPVSATWDRRNDPLDPTGGFFLAATAAPFAGFDETGSGLRLTADGRAYRALGAAERVVFALRLQLGSIYGPSLVETPRDFLFYSGGGGTVRGQDYQSLGVNELPGGIRSGGQHFAGIQAELRARVTERIAAVGFFDAGHVAATDWGDASGETHSGAGFGIRYDTGIGPIRVDVGFPVAGDGGGVQFYIGIGQAF